MQVPQLYNLNVELLLQAGGDASIIDLIVLQVEGGGIVRDVGWDGSQAPVIAIDEPIVTAAN